MKLVKLLKNTEQKKIEFKLENEDEINEYYETIKKFWKILLKEENEDLFEFKFIPGQNYTVTCNGAVAKKTSGGDQYNSTIIGKKRFQRIE